MLGTIKHDITDQAAQPTEDGHSPKTAVVATVQLDSHNKETAAHHVPSLEALEHSRKLGVYIWLLPSLMLRIAIYLFIVGILALLWMEPQSVEAGRRSDIAIVSSVFFCLALFSHMFSMLWLSRHATPVKVVKGKREKAKEIARSLTFTSARQSSAHQTDVEQGKP